jgi:hypothetical protein
MLMQAAQGFVDKLAKVKTKVCGADILIRACNETQISTGQQNTWVQTLSTRAGCSEQVSLAVVQKQVSMYAVAALHLASTISRQLCGSLQGRMKDRSGTVGLNSNPDEVRTSLTNASKSIELIEGAVRARVTANKKVQKHSKVMEDALESVITILREGEARMLKCAFMGKRKERQDYRVQGLFDDTKQVVKTLVKLANELDIEQEELDLEQVDECCQSMVKMLGYSELLDEKSSEEVQKSIALRSTVRQNWSQKEADHMKLVKKMDRVKHEQNSAQASFDLICDAQALNVTTAKAMCGGQGSLTMKGRNRSDPHAEKIYKLWEDSAFDELRKMGHYKSGGFEFTVDPNPTPRQEECEKCFEQAVAKVDAAKREHQEKMEAFDNELQELIAEEPGLQQEARIAKAEWDRVQKTDEKSWAEFRMQSPNEFAEVMLMFRMQEMVNLSAIHMVDDGVKVGEIKGLTKALQRMTEDVSDFDLTAVLSLALRMQQLISDPDKSPVGFLFALPAADLSKALQPRVSGMEACESFLEGFSAQAHQQLASLEDQQQQGPPAQEVN